MINGSLPIRGTFPFFGFHKAFHIFLCNPILLVNGKYSPIFFSPQICIGIPVYLITLNLKSINSSIIYLTHQKYHVMELFICMDTMLTGIYSKTPNFTILMQMPIMKIIILLSTVLFIVKLPSRIIHTVLEPNNLFKTLDVTFKLRSVNKISFIPYLVGCLLKSLSTHF